MNIPYTYTLTQFAICNTPWAYMQIDFCNIYCTYVFLYILNVTTLFMECSQ